MTDYRSRSFWLDDTPEDLVPRPSLDRSIEADVAIVGAGFTGLWTAYYLKQAEPGLRVVVLEKEIAGFGASGRNGGWVSSMFATPLATLAEESGREAAVAMQRAMIDTVAEIGRVVEQDGIEAGYHRGGMLWVSTSPAQTPRLQAVVAEQRSFGYGETDWTWLERADVLSRLRVEGCRGAVFSPHYASVQPARLARGLARRVEELGATIYERTPAVGIEPGAAQTPAGSVAARSVILATEAYSVELPGHERDVVPIYDFMIATAPLPAAAWDEIGWAGREVLSDGRYMIVYAQRTADGRVAIGGTTAPYYYGSRISERLERPAAIYERVHRALRLLLPAAGEVEVTHRWGGVLGATRDWHTTAEYDARTGLGFAGGYVGDGVATANLAGRTLRDLILGLDSELVRLPWVGHRSRRWEPEPLRWLAATGVNLVLSHADRVEFGTGRSVRWQPLLEKLEQTVGW